MIDTQYIASLFERDPSMRVYPTLRDELEAVHVRKKGVSATSFGSLDDPDRVNFIDRAKELGLVVVERVFKHDSAPNYTSHQVFALHDDEMWRIEALAVLGEGLRTYPMSDSSEYILSVTLGYSREQAASWISWHRHRSAWWGPTLYFFMSHEQRSAIQRLYGRYIPTNIEPAMLAFHPLAYDVVLKKDASVLIPETIILGRVGIRYGVIETVFDGVAANDGFLTTRCSEAKLHAINCELTSNVEFWSETGWTVNRG